jgi:hypothetical protein
LARWLGLGKLIAMDKIAKNGGARWRWLAARLWAGSPDWVFLYRDSFLQSDIELIDRRTKSGYVERNGDLIKLTARGQQDLNASNEKRVRTCPSANDRRVATSQEQPLRALHR